MNILYLLPFNYFLNTRLLKSSLFFHLLFEWMMALILVGLFGTRGLVDSVFFSAGAYLAFIALYEIGYLYNDLIASRAEQTPRLRGPEQASSCWLFCWITIRLIVFLAMTGYLNMVDRSEWWLFFLALIMVFSLHNRLQVAAIKTITFQWLAWFRFIAPVIFVVEANQRMGIAFGAASLYSVFRLFGYMDSKGLLLMPERKNIEFRSIFFTLPLLVVAALWPYQEAAGFRVMALYFSAIAMVAWLTEKVIRYFAGD